jgi:hypothetical protein
MEASRNDNPMLRVEYAYKKKLLHRPEWKWVRVYELDEFEDLRRVFMAKFEHTPEYKIGVQSTDSSVYLRRTWINLRNTIFSGFPWRRMTYRLTNIYLITWFLIVSLMEEERGRSLQVATTP